MGRKPIGERAMTAAERKRRQRGRRPAEKIAEGLIEAISVVNGVAAPVYLKTPAPAKADDGGTLIGRRVAPVGSLLKRR